MKNLLLILFFATLVPAGFGQDTLIVIGDDPTYIDTTIKLYRGLKNKLTPGVYAHYYDDCVYKSKFNKSYPRAEKCKGQLMEICIYGEDSLIVYRKSYYLDSTRKRLVPNGVIHYKNGIWHGVVIEFNKNGTVNSIGSYKEGEKHGTWFYMGASGTEPGQVEYINGKRKE